MGSFDGAETCELVGCYILSRLTEKYGNSIGLYRDDGLSAFNKTPQEIERIKKDICQIFRDNDLKITALFRGSVSHSSGSKLRLGWFVSAGAYCVHRLCSWHWAYSCRIV